MMVHDLQCRHKVILELRSLKSLQAKCFSTLMFIIHSWTMVIWLVGHKKESYQSCKFISFLFNSTWTCFMYNDIIFGSLWLLHFTEKLNPLSWWNINLLASWWIPKFLIFDLMNDLMKIQCCTFLFLISSYGIWYF